MTTNGCLEEKVVFVNGGARGIGAAAAHRIAREGAVLSVQDDAAARGGPVGTRVSARHRRRRASRGRDRFRLRFPGIGVLPIEPVPLSRVSVRDMLGTSRLNAFARSPIATALPGKLDAVSTAMIMAIGAVVLIDFVTGLLRRPIRTGSVETANPPELVR